MIVFRHADARYPFLWESAGQPAARWHGEGEGPVAYFAETPDGAWAEFLRHEEITDPADLAGVVRSIWAIELPEPPVATPRLPAAVMTGDRSTYDACRAEARRLRSRAAGLIAPSAALLPRTPSGFRVDGGLRPAASRRERVLVLFGPQPDPRRVVGVRGGPAAGGPAGPGASLPLTRGTARQSRPVTQGRQLASRPGGSARAIGTVARRSRRGPALYSTDRAAAGAGSRTPAGPRTLEVSR